MVEVLLLDAKLRIPFLFPQIRGTQLENVALIVEIAVEVIGPLLLLRDEVALALRLLQVAFALLLVVAAPLLLLLRLRFGLLLRLRRLVLRFRRRRLSRLGYRRLLRVNPFQSALPRFLMLGRLLSFLFALFLLLGLILLRVHRSLRDPESGGQRERDRYSIFDTDHGALLPLRTYTCQFMNDRPPVTCRT